MQALFRNKIFIICTLSIVFLTFILVSQNPDSKINILGNSISIPATPLQGILSGTWNKISNTFGFVGQMYQVNNENISLKKEIEALKSENRELNKYKNENIELKKILNFKDKLSNYNFTGANIVAKDVGNWFSIFTIDAGNRDNVKIDDPVISSNGLVGRILTVGVNSSKVLCIIDSDSSVAAILSKTRDDVVVKGDLSLKFNSSCRMELIPPEADVKFGDIVETSGLGGIFPKGIKIGEVLEVRATDNGMSRIAVIKTGVDFRRLENVIVLTGGDTYE
jgi:rod shape-determining protein MreC